MGIPRKDASAVVEYAELHGARVIGPNCLGIIVPDVCRFGSLGGPAVDCRKAFKPGVVGVMSRSGGMTTEICNALTLSGLGVSTAISIGGDPVIGSTYADLIPLFEADAVDLGRRVLDMFGSGLTLDDGRHVPCSLSIGAAWSANGAEGVHTLLRRADDALYAAKSDGKDTIRAASS